jgi:hypothetical protein
MCFTSPVSELITTRTVVPGRHIRSCSVSESAASRFTSGFDQKFRNVGTVNHPEDGDVWEWWLERNSP